MPCGSCPYLGHGVWKGLVCTVLIAAKKLHQIRPTAGLAENGSQAKPLRAAPVAHWNQLSPRVRRTTV